MMSDNNNHNIIGLALAVVIDMILLMAYVSLSLAAYSGELDIVTYVRFTLLWLVILLVSLVVFQIPRLFVQYGQVFFKLSPAETRKLVQRLILGPSQYPPQEPVLNIQDGQIISEEPGVLEQLGGPGFLGVEHNNAVVTQRLGIISRVLGPGFYTLEPFEKVWDVVDLRPQRRTINVQFMTRDGIPASVDAEVVFRIPFIDEYMQMKQNAELSMDTAGLESETVPLRPTSFSTDAVLTVTTGKVVNGPLARSKVTDWAMSLPEDIVDGTVRDVLERYTLDAFLYPQYWLSLKESVNHDGETEYKLVRPQPLENHKKQIESTVITLAEENGIFVEYVELGPVMPLEDAISRAWLEFWQAKLQSVVYQHSIGVNVDPAQNDERVGVGMLVDIITSTVQKIQGLAENELEVPPELSVLSFLGVLRSMSEADPDFQKMVNRNVEKLTHIVDIIQRTAPPAEDMQSAPTL